MRAYFSTLAIKKKEEEEDNKMPLLQFPKLKC